LRRTPAWPPLPQPLRSWRASSRGTLCWTVHKGVKACQAATALLLSSKRRAKGEGARGERELTELYNGHEGRLAQQLLQQRRTRAHVCC